MRNDWHATFKNNIFVISCKSAHEAKPMKLQNTKGIISANHSDNFFELYCSMLLNSSPASSLRGSEVLRKSEFSSTWRTPTLHECTEFASLHFECHFPANWTTCSPEARCLDLGAGVRKQCSQAYSIESWYAYTVTKSGLALVICVQTVVCSRLNFFLWDVTWYLGVASIVSQFKVAWIATELSLQNRFVQNQNRGVLLHFLPLIQRLMWNQLSLFSRCGRGNTSFCCDAGDCSHLLGSKTGKLPRSYLISLFPARPRFSTAL